VFTKTLRSLDSAEEYLSLSEFASLCFTAAYEFVLCDAVVVTINGTG